MPTLLAKARPMPGSMKYPMACLSTCPMTCPMTFPMTCPMSNSRSNDMLNASMCIDPPDNLK
eukprot:852019-Amorphochlora_amoeboformis.AAC.1